jgi:DNA polymerase III subunit gamma/tau
VSANEQGHSDPDPLVKQSTERAVVANTDEPFVSLYRRFRPSTLAEIRGQPHVVQALRRAVAEGRVAHAYLFSGPRGTGKTSAARVLAKALNCTDPKDGEPCGVCESCIGIAAGTSLDVRELDAASNNGVEAMRDLVAHAALATPGRWKLYIVDEVHMLSTAAANALLKTLEEPPAHVVFVLATTDPQKVPLTVRSRTQHYEFRLLGTETLFDLLSSVRDQAGLDLDDDAIGLAVRRGRGSARDALSALDQMASSGTLEGVRPELSELIDALCEESAERALTAVAGLVEAGWTPQQLASEAVDDLRQAFLISLAPDLASATGPERDRLAEQARQLGLPRLVRAIEALGLAQVDMREAPDTRVVLEVTLVRLALVELDTSTSALADRLARLEHAVAQRGPTQSDARSGGAPPIPSPPAGEHTQPRPALGAYRRQRAPEPVADPPAPQPPVERTDPEEPVSAPSGRVPDRDTLVEAWGDTILKSLPARAKTFFSPGRFVSVEDSVAVFALPNARLVARCEEARPLVEDALLAYFGTSLRIRLVEEPSDAAGPAHNTAAQPQDEDSADYGVELDAQGESVELDSLVRSRLLEAFPGAEEVS